MKLAVWYHTRMEGGTPPIDPEYSLAVMAEQMAMLKESGLEAAADEILISVNGGAVNAMYAATMAPDKARIIDNGPQAESHLPAVCRIREWLPGHAGWYVCYNHPKGVTHPGNRAYELWRQCQDQIVYAGWRQCVKNLDDGFDSAGAHWLTPEKYGPLLSTPIWGGMAFWAKADFLATLPALPEAPTCREDWFKSEHWIGSGPRRPRVMDYAPHWPCAPECHP